MKFVAGGDAGAVAGAGLSAEAKANVQALITLITNMRGAISSGNITQLVIFIQQFFPALRKLQGSISSPNDRSLILNIFGNITRMAITAKSGNKAGANSLSVEIENDLKKLGAGGAGGATGGAGGAAGGKNGAGSKRFNSID